MNFHQLVLSSEGSERMLVALAVYTVMCREQNHISLAEVILGLLNTDETAETILAKLFEGEEPSREAQVLTLCEAAHNYLEKQRLICEGQQGGKRRRFNPPLAEKEHLASQIRKAVDNLYPSMPNRKATYEEVAERSLELFGCELTAGQIEGRYRWIISRPNDRY